MSISEFMVVPNMKGLAPYNLERLIASWAALNGETFNKAVHRFPEDYKTFEGRFVVPVNAVLEASHQMINGGMATLLIKCSSDEYARFAWGVGRK